MFEKIIVGYDGTERAADALALARMMAGAVEGRVVLARVLPYEPLLSEVSIGPPTTLVAQRESTQDELERVSRSLGLEAKLVESTSPARGLHEFAARRGADLIVLGSSHRGRLGRVLAGSVGRAVLTGAPCAVAVAPHGYRDEEGRTPNVIGVGLDSSDEAKAALSTAAKLAHRIGASVRIIAAVPPINYAYTGAWVVADPDLARSRHERCQGEVDEAASSLPSELRVEKRVVDGDPVTVLVDESKAVGILVVGSRGLGRVRGTLLGSVSAELIKSAACPVVAVPHLGQGPGPRAGRGLANAAS